VVLINEGRVVYDGGLADLQREYGSGWKVRVTYTRDAAPPEVSGLTGTVGDEHRYAGTDPADQRDLLRRLLDRDDVEDLQAHGDDLEEVMAEVYRRRSAAIEVAS